MSINHNDNDRSLQCLWLFFSVVECLSFSGICLCVDTIEEFNVDSRAEYSAVGYLAHVARRN